MRDPQTQPPILKRGMSTSAAIILGISGIIIATIIATAIIFVSETKTFRDIGFESLEPQSNEQTNTPSVAVSGPTEESMAFMIDLSLNEGEYFADLDYVQWLIEEEGRDAAIEDGNCEYGCMENGYYIRNNNDKIRTYPFSPTAEIILPTNLSPVENIELSPSELFSSNSTYIGGVGSLFNVTVKNGLITEMNWVYRP